MFRLTKNSPPRLVITDRTKSNYIGSSHRSKVCMLKGMKFKHGTRYVITVNSTEQGESITVREATLDEKALITRNKFNIDPWNNNLVNGDILLLDVDNISQTELHFDKI